MTTMPYFYLIFKRELNLIPLVGFCLHTQNSALAIINYLKQIQVKISFVGKWYEYIVINLFIPMGFMGELL